MKLTLVSEDPALVAVCRAFVADLADHEWELAVARPDDVGLSDFCIWDFRPALSLPAGIDWESGHVFLVNREDLRRSGKAH